tara:strand:+ start:492 stop:1016 length:525 start_codon:yes stop_codon:yes gene_type:complete
MSELRTNRIVPRDGLPSGSSGGIIQVKSTTKTDTFNTSTSDSFVDITGLSVTITPTRSDSKILILYDTQLSGTELMFIQLVRNSTAIKVGDSDGANRVECTAGGFKQEENQDKSVPFSGTFLDSPATTSATTYKLQGRVYGTSQTFRVNAPNNDSNASYTGRACSTITVMEVSG